MTYASLTVTVTSVVAVAMDTAVVVDGELLDTGVEGDDDPGGTRPQPGRVSGPGGQLQCALAVAVLDGDDPLNCLVLCHVFIVARFAQHVKLIGILCAHQY